MQPTYLPWAGYFNLIASVDTFVFLDDVQFDRRSWQSRNRIFDGGKVAWLSCPVKKAPRETLIQDLSLSDDVNWQQVHAKKIQLNYANAPFFSEMESILHALVNLHSCSLSNVNQTLIREICQRLEIHTNFVNASELKLPGQRSEHLLNICKYLSCEQYLSPQGSKDYLLQDGTFSHSGVELAFQSYEPQPYSQKHSNEFVSHLSIIDVIANIGLNQTKQYILG
ncbi:WbqC family protein [Glaciecola sp. SC05]|uniref:WbqC family protein n=1 Tax=Glaciecola sp. SC05 TaxID=1987355 RepID=UPI00352777BD